MDYTGIDYGKLRYRVNRGLTCEEREGRLDPSISVSFEPNCYLSVISCSDEYIELVDRWYPVKGFNVWIGMMIGLAVLPTSFYFIWSIAFHGIDLKPGEGWIIWFALLVTLPIFIFVLYGVTWLVKSECFRWTHYPMRLNRKTGVVHVFRQNGTVLSVPWGDLFLCVAESSSSVMGKTNDLRAHVLSAERDVVIETFTLGYVYMGEREDVLNLWEFIRRYMEGAAYSELLPGESLVCVPVRNRREGFAFGVVRVFANFVRWPWAHLVFSLPFSLIALGRWLAMRTSKVPVWPVEVEMEISVEADGVRDWRGNPKLGFLDLTWPMICLVIGVATAIAIVVALS